MRGYAPTEMVPIEEPHDRFPSALDAIGRTPLIELRHIPGDRGRILAKLEFLDPGGFKKDRIALQMIRDVEQSGDLEAGQPVVWGKRRGCSWASAPART